MKTAKTICLFSQVWVMLVMNFFQIKSFENLGQNPYGFRWRTLCSKKFNNLFKNAFSNILDGEIITKTGQQLLRTLAIHVQRTAKCFLGLAWGAASLERMTGDFS